MLLFAAGAVPACIAVALIDRHLYGSALATGYGPFESLYSWSFLGKNLARYPGWIVQTETAIVLLAFIAPFVLKPEPSMPRPGAASAPTGCRVAFVRRAERAAVSLLPAMGRVVVRPVFDAVVSADARVDCRRPVGACRTAGASPSGRSGPGRRHGSGGGVVARRFLFPRTRRAAAVGCRAAIQDRGRLCRRNVAPSGGADLHAAQRRRPFLFGPDYRPLRPHRASRPRARGRPVASTRLRSCTCSSRIGKSRCSGRGLPGRRRSAGSTGRRLPASTAIASTSTTPRADKQPRPSARTTTASDGHETCRANPCRRPHLPTNWPTVSWPRAIPRRLRPCAAFPVERALFADRPTGGISALHGSCR